MRYKNANRFFGDRLRYCRLKLCVKGCGNFPDKKIIVLTKTTADETNTKYAQGGIAVVNDLENDSFEKHIEDTFIAGDGLCNEKMVEIVVKEGPERVNEIIEWGAKFDKDPDGDYKLGREGGHSEFRILHHKDITGKEMERALLVRSSRLQILNLSIIVLLLISLPSIILVILLQNRLLI